MRRTNVSFASAGTSCRAWFYTSASRATRPCVVMAHGLGGVKEMRLDAYAERFAREGYHVLVFDYRGFGGSDGDPRRVVDVPGQHADWRAAIDFARTQSEVDAGRTILWGSCFDFDQSIAARSVFSLMRYSPGHTAERISVPTLVQVALRDQTTPAAAAASVAAKIPLGELETYDTDHFSPYVGETFEAFVADQIAFLRRHVQVGC